MLFLKYRDNAKYAPMPSKISIEYRKDLFLLIGGPSHQYQV